MKGGLNLFGQNQKEKICANIVNQLTPIRKVRTDYGELLFFCPGDIPLWRAKTLLTKEVDTIAWINDFDDGSVFWDIGANVGTYSLYAAKKGDIQVFAFEPASVNYHILTRNIEINKLDSVISALCIALSDHTSFDYFYMSSTEQGSAFHTFGEKYDAWGKPFQPVLKQAMIGFSIDEFLSKFNLPAPNYIKIDVDSIEDKIIQGASRMLGDQKLKSILVELDPGREDYLRNVVEFIESHGFIRTNKGKELSNNGDDIPRNYIFHRLENKFVK